MARLVMVLVVALNASVASAQSLKIPTSLFVASAGLDAVTTYHNLSGGATEANPALAPIKSPTGITAAMIGSDVLVLLAAHRLHVEHHPKIAWTLLLVGAGIHGWAGTHNLGVWAHPIVYAPVPTSITASPMRHP